MENSSYTSHLLLPKLFLQTYPWLDKELQNLTCFLSHRVGLWLVEPPCGSAHHRVALISVSAALSQTPNYCARPQIHSYCIACCACLCLVFYTGTILYFLVTVRHTGVNNLPKAVTGQHAAWSQTNSWPTSYESNTWEPKIWNHQRKTAGAGCSGIFR